MAGNKSQGNMVIGFKGDTRDLQREIKKARGAVDKFSSNAKRGLSKFDKKLGLLTKGFAGLAIAMGAVKLARFVTDAAAAGDKIGKSAKNVGLAAEEFQTLSFAAGQSGVSIDLFQKSMLKLSKASVDAQDGLQTTVRAFTKMGIPIKELRGLKPDELLKKTADGLQSMADPVEKAAAAMAIFGTRGADMITFLNEGSKGIEALQAEAQKLGIVLSNETTAGAEHLNDQITIMKKQFTKQWITLWVDWGDSIISLAQNFGAAAENVGLFFASFDTDSIRTSIKLVNDFSKASAEQLEKRRKMVSQQLIDLTSEKTLNKELFDAKTNELSALIEEIKLRDQLAKQKAATKKAETENASDAKQKAQDKAAKSRADALQKEANILVEQTTPAVEKYLDTLERIDELESLGKFASPEQADQIRVFYENLIAQTLTAKEAIKEMGEEGGTAFTVIHEKMTEVIDGMSSELAQFVMTGKADFASLAQSIIQDLLKIQIQKAIVGIAGSLFPSFGAATATAASATGGAVIGARAAGGPVQRGRPYKVGEQGRPEIFIPTENGRIDNGALGGSPGGVTVNVQNTGSPQDVERADVRQSPDGFVVDIVMRDINRGGPISQGFSRKFGVTRR